VSTPIQRLINRLLALRNRHFLGLDLLLLLCSPWLAFAVRTDGLNSQPPGWDILSRFTLGLFTYRTYAIFMPFLLYGRDSITPVLLQLRKS
jgi:hypothetical protein